MMVRAVEKAFRVLETFDPLHSRQTLTQLAQRAGIDRSAAQRFAHTLLNLGYLQKVPGSKTYELAAKSLNMAYRYTRSSLLVQRAHPICFISIAAPEKRFLSPCSTIQISFILHVICHQTRLIMTSLLVAGCRHIAQQRDWSFWLVLMTPKSTIFWRAATYEPIRPKRF